MSHMDYIKFRKRHHHHHGAGSCSIRGFRLRYPRKFSVHRLRARFFCLFRFLNRWRSCYGQAVQSLKRGVRRNNIKRCGSGSSKRGLMMDANCNHKGAVDHHQQYMFRSFGRSNSFYTEAIADCLEFIKRSSVSVEQKQGISPR